MRDSDEVRELRLWHALFFGALAVAAAGTAVSGDGTATTLALAAGLAAWHAVFVVSVPPDGLPSAFRHALWVTGSAALLGLAVASEPGFLLVLIALYPQLYYVLGGRLAVPAVVGVTALAYVVVPGMTVAQRVASFLVSTGLAVAIGYVLGLTEQRAERQGRRIDELQVARAELEAALAENRRLQDRLVERAHVEGVHTERERLARELHDTVAQGLIGVVVQLETAEQAHRRGDHDAAALRVDRARALAREALTESRRAMAALRPELLDGTGLTGAIARLVERAREEGPPAVVLRLEGPPPAGLDAEHEVTLLRCVQEGLANARRHARAEEVVITLRSSPAEVIVQVLDDGCGFDPGAVAPHADGGAGLAGMRERLTALGGRLEVASAPGHGTALSARLPLEVPAPAA